MPKRSAGMSSLETNMPALRLGMAPLAYMAGARQSLSDADKT